MKKVRFLVAMMLVVAALTVGVMAASTDYADFKTKTIACDGNAITVEVVSANGFESAYASFNVTLDASKWTISGLPSQAGQTGNNIAFIYDTGLTVAADGTVFTFTATPTGEDVASIFQLKECMIANADMTDVLMQEDGIYSTLTVEAATTAADPTYTGTVGVADLQGASGVVYTNVWTGNYTVALNGNAITKIGLRFAGKSDDAFASNMTADGTGSVAYKVAIVGAPKGTEATPIVYTTEWIAAVAQ